MSRKNEEIGLTEACGCFLLGIVLISIPVGAALLAKNWKAAAGWSGLLIALLIPLFLFARHLQYLERFIPKPRKRWKGRDEHLQRILRKKERERVKEGLNQMSEKPEE